MMIKLKRIKRIALGIFFIGFIICSSGYSENNKEEMKQYISKINPVLINVQMTSRNISQKLLSLEAAVKQIREYLVQLQAIKPPSFIAKQHKMILLSFKKMKTGFYLLSKGDRPDSIPLVKKGAALLRTAAKDIVDFAKKEGLVKDTLKAQGSRPEGK